MKHLLITVLCLMAYTATANPLAPVVWLHGTGTPTTNEVFVASYWWQQFPDREDTDGKQLAIACPKAMWQSWGAAKKAAVMDAFEKLLDGSVQVTRAKLAVWKDRFTDAGIAVELVLPGDTPTVGMKLYIIVVGDGENSNDRLRGLGLEPPPSEDI